MNAQPAEYPDTEFQAFLASIGACAPARKWVGGMTVDEAWASCQSYVWMRWALIYADPRVRAAARRVALADAARRSDADAYRAAADAYWASALDACGASSHRSTSDAVRSAFPIFPHPTTISL